jgi:GR25 family glycosyltransferase involved in LPS biosynthesis
MNYPNRHCIRLEKKIFKKAMFQSSVDATYIIHLEGNGRLPSIEKQLVQYQPSNLVYIAFNKGYKNCQKKLPYQLPAYDLVDTFLYIFQHANENGFKNILVLEDDFIFSPEIRQDIHLNNINNFLIDKQDDTMMYFLGCLLWLQLPYNNHTSINLLSTGTHGVIYSFKAREYMLRKKIIPIFDWDIYNIFFTNIRRYVYYKPLCYQLFPETENSNNWPSLFGFHPIKLYIKYNHLDIKVDNGYSNAYKYSKIFGYLYLLIIIILIFMIISYLWNNRKKFKVKFFKKTKK